MFAETPKNPLLKYEAGISYTPKNINGDEKTVYMYFFIIKK